MKENFKMPRMKILVVLLAVVLSMCACNTALAADSTATVNIPVYKVITGDTPAKAETFTFRLTAAGNTPMPSGSVNGVKTMTISGAGNTTFGEITYTEPGNYRYTISEAVGGNAAYTYDATVYGLTVQVTWTNEAGGGMQAVMCLVKQGGTEKQEKAVFTNKYTTSAVIVDPPVQKVISGDMPQADSTFTFYMKADKTAYPMPGGSSGGLKSITIKGAGKNDFGNITFTEAGTYTYTVYEQKGGVSGYTYDTTVYAMKVTVIQADGKLSAVQEITDEKGDIASGLIFANKYSAGAAPTVSPTASPTAAATGKTDGPKTGDASKDYIWWMLLGAAVIGIAVALCCIRKRKC